MFTGSGVFFEIGGRVFDVAELYDKPLMAVRDTQLYIDGGNNPYKIVKAGELIGKVYSHIDTANGRFLSVDRADGNYFVGEDSYLGVIGAESEEEKYLKANEKKLAFQWPDFIPQNWRVYVTWGAAALLLLFVLGLLSRVLGFVKFSAFTKLFKKR
jgi:hypothetical protein